MLNPNVPPGLRDLVDRELEHNERIEWSGMPRPVSFTPVAAGVFLFGIPWTACTVFWTVTTAWAAVNGKEAEAFKLFIGIFSLCGLPMILVGLWLLSFPIWTRRKAVRTVYVITDCRAITFDGGWSTTIRSYPPDKLTEVYRRERKDGSGDVIIARRAWRDSEGDRRSEELGFLRVVNAREVERRLRELAADSETASGKTGLG